MTEFSDAVNEVLVISPRVRKIRDEYVTGAVTLAREFDVESLGVIHAVRMALAAGVEEDAVFDFVRTAAEYAQGTIEENHDNDDA